MYAIVKVGGKQYRVEKGDSLVVDRMPADEGAEVTLEPLLLADGDKTVFEGSDLEQAKVEAKVSGHERGPKVRVLKFKPKRGYKRRQGHRSELTRLEIADIAFSSSARPSSGATSKPKAAAGASATVTGEKPAAKKPPAKQPAAKKPPAEKPPATATKPASTKAAAKKPAANKEDDDGS